MCPLLRGSTVCSCVPFGSHVHIGVHPFKSVKMSRIIRTYVCTYVCKLHMYILTCVCNIFFLCVVQQIELETETRAVHPVDTVCPSGDPGHGEGGASPGVHSVGSQPRLRAVPALWEAVPTRNSRETYPLLQGEVSEDTHQSQHNGKRQTE